MVEKIKPIVLLDGDGVLLQPYAKPFSERYSENQEIPIEEVLQFFKGEYQDCLIGKSDIYDVLPKYFESLKWNGTVQEFLDLWFTTEGEPNQDVVNIMNDLQSEGVEVGLATNKTKAHGRYILEKLDGIVRFDSVFMSHEMGVRKPDPEFFNRIVEKTGLEPKKIYFWDDDEENIQIAKSVGLKAKLFTNASEIRESLI